MQSKTRFWIELLAVIFGIACVLAVFFSTVAASSRALDEPSTQQSGQAPSSDEHGTKAQGFNSQRASAQTANPQVGVQTYEGVVTDAMRCETYSSHC